MDDSSKPKSRPKGDWGSLVFWRPMRFYLVHVGCLAVFFVPFSPQLLLLCMGLYVLRMFGITAGYHRYFAHRSYKTGRAFQFLMAVTGLLALQKGPLWWAAHHRRHHRYSDQGGDPHSPKRDGFLWAHMGWILSKNHEATHYDQIRDFAKYPELVWLNRYYLVPPLSLAGLLLLLGGFPAFVWGFIISTVLTWHATFFVNSLTHLVGRRRYATSDDSRNSFFIALITMGEGWHNNHHHYMGSTRQGFFWFEIDLSYYLLRLVAATRLIWDLREPPKRVLEAPRLEPAFEPRLDTVA